jgi:thiamine-phosphate pyrophosphorylase
LCLPYSATPRTPARALLLCYITDRSQFAGTPEEQERQLLNAIAECAAAGVDYIQLREKDLPVRSLELLAEKAMAAIPAGSPARLLINSRTDVALACGAHGVHLPSRSLPASEVRAIWGRASRSAPIIGVSTHSAEEVASAEAHGADFAVFAPVFEKNGASNPAGLDQLREVCRRPPITGTPMPVLALGGITLENARLCLQAGAAGIAAIRLFQQGDIAEIVRNLRSVFADA